MKKLLVAVAALLTCVGMNAQFWAGGSLGFNMTNYDFDGAETQMDFNLAPTVGYALSDNLEVGLSFSYGMTNNMYGIKDADWSKISITPFARYTFLQEGKIGLFVDGMIGYEKFGDDISVAGPTYNEYFHDPITYNREIGDGSQIKVGVAPGVKIALTDELTLASTFGFFGFSHHAGTDTGTVDNNKFGIDANTTFSFGLYYAF